MLKEGSNSSYAASDCECHEDAEHANESSCLRNRCAQIIKLFSHIDVVIKAVTYPEIEARVFVVKVLQGADRIDEWRPSYADDEGALSEWLEWICKDKEANPEYFPSLLFNA